MSQDTLTLVSDNAEAIVDLEGGRLSSLCVYGLQLLVTEGAKPSRFGSFPMVPWCGRLANGVLDFGAERHEFPLTSPPHANHGRGYLQRWQAISETEIRTDLLEPWPFGGHVVQRFELSALSLTVTLEVHAEGRSMPAMVGWHPWFRRQLDRGEPAQLTFAADSAYAVDEAMVPTRELIPTPAEPWDDCFIDVTEEPRITWPGALRVDLTSSMDHWVVYTKPEHALCVEPQSGPPNQVNSDPRLAEPGKPLVGAMTIRWSPPLLEKTPLPGLA